MRVCAPSSNIRLQTQQMPRNGLRFSFSTTYTPRALLTMADDEDVKPSVKINIHIRNDRNERTLHPWNIAFSSP